MRCRCPECNAILEHPDLQEGRRVQCWGCEAKFTAMPEPLSEAEVEPEPVPESFAEPVAIAAFDSGTHSVRVSRPAPAGKGAAVIPRRRRAFFPAAIVAVLIAVVAYGWRLVGPKGAGGAAAAFTAEASSTAVKPIPAGPLDSELDAAIAAGTFEDFNNRLIATLVAVTAEQLADSPVFGIGLAQQQTIETCGPRALAKIAEVPGGTEFLRQFLRNRDWLESFLASDPPAGNDYGQAAAHLALICSREQARVAQPLYRRLATAVALSAGGQSPYRVVKCFQQWANAHEQGLMHASFETLDVREIRWTIAFGLSDSEHAFIQDSRQSPLDAYFGACWAIPYRTYNDFGDTIQGPQYYPPWMYSGSDWEVKYKVGGVCGTLSTFGSMSTKVHGIPSTPVGQPGHCAYVIRKGDAWPVAYSVTWPTGFAAPGWSGTGYATAHRLYEPLHADREAFLAASRIAWLSRLQQASERTSVTILPAVKWARYRTPGPKLPDFTTLTPEAEGSADEIRHGDAIDDNRDHYGIVWNAEVEVAKGRNVRLFLRSDDEARVLVDDQEVARTNCTTFNQIVKIEPGHHQLRVEYTEGGGADYLEFSLVGAPRGGEWIKTFEAALASQPGNYGLWLEYVGYLESLPSWPTSRWTEVARRAAGALAGCPEAGWALARRSLGNADALNARERLDLLVALNQSLRETAAVRFERFPYDSVLDWQVQYLNDPALENELFSQLLKIHRTPPPNDWTWGQILEWGRKRWSKNAETTAAFTQILATAFAEGDNLGAGQLRGVIQGGIAAAEEKEDVVLFQRWNDLARKLLPDEFKDEKLADAAALGGELLSDKGLLRISTTSRWDQPLKHWNVIAGTPGSGSFHTESETNPWAKLVLPGDCELSTILVINTPGNSGRQLPATVSISADGKEWTSVGRFDNHLPEWKIDLAGKKLRARYIKVEREEGRQEYFHLNSILVYGTRLY